MRLCQVLIIQMQQKTNMDIGVTALPDIPKDTSDRNRTSPFAFTGNKFEFRMSGSAFNVACTNTVLNTAVAESLRQFADELEQAADFDQALTTLIVREIKAHQRIVLNGNGYDDAWLAEAKKRGLHNLPSAPEGVFTLYGQKELTAFYTHNVYTPVEVGSREEILLEEYTKTIHIEALTMLDMLQKRFFQHVCAMQRILQKALPSKNKLALMHQ